MPYYIASDHAGFELKNRLRLTLKPRFEFTDLGVFVAEPVDYPDIAIKLAKKVATEKGALGVLVCGTGIGMSIAANKVPGVRAAVLYDGFSAKMAREHNDANIACVGARAMSEMMTIEMIKLFLTTPFSGHTKEGERHLLRVKKIEQIEKEQFKRWQGKPEKKGSNNAGASE